MASSQKDVKVDVKATIEPFPQTIEQTGRAWAAREAASVMRARALVSSGTVSPYDVIILANWISTGEQPDLDGSVAIEYEGEAGVAGTDWPGAHVVRLGPGQYAPIREKLVNSLYGNGSTRTVEQAVSEFLGDLGIRVEVVA